MTDFVVKVNTGYDVRYYSTPATVVQGLRDRRFYGFMGDRDRIEGKVVEIFVKNGKSFDERAFLDLLKANEEGDRHLYEPKQKRAWRDNIIKNIDAIMAGAK